jgi:indole-3-glycerol phosphate synthase
MKKKIRITIKEIVEEKRRQIQEAKSLISIDQLRAGALKREKRSFRRAIVESKKVALIAELKKASPSKGLLAPDFNAARLTDLYSANGAAALSVLTEPAFFMGDLAYIVQARQRCDLPVLRKDFILEEYQVYESRHYGADCVLLIAALLTADQIADLVGLAHKLDMEALVEVHSFEDVEKTLVSNFDVIGVNNRNLKTMTVALSSSQALAAKIPEDAVKISESGIATREDIERLAEWGYQGALVGETLVIAADVGAKVRELAGFEMTFKA